MASILPTGGAVAFGSASILTRSGTSLVVNQSSRSAIINWGTFSIGQRNAVSFNNGSGSTLNRVTGNVPSRIDGSLSATGSVYLVNPAGVTVGSTGKIATGGSFVASTLDIADADFMNGGDMTFSGSSTATVVNAGTIGSLGGDVALIARAVDNSGTITAPKGTAALVAGYEVLVSDGDLDGGKFQVKVGGADTEVKTRGKIQAAAAELRANGGNVYALAGNTGGIVAATGTAKKDGRIFLTAGDDGTVEAGGTITASKAVADPAVAKSRNGKSAAQNAKSGGDIRVSGGTTKVSGTLSAKGTGAKAAGGTIVVAGKAITLTDTAVVDASGTAGGVILIGGDFQGGKDATTKLLPEAVATAATTTVASGARIVADGTVGGGGRVVVWSDDLTTFEGSVTAHGGRGSNGGDVEISGKAVLDFRGSVDLTAENGTTGTLLLDPYNLTIYDGANSATTVPPNVSAMGEEAFLNVDTLQNALQSANVTVSTSGSTGTGTEEGNIVVTVPVSWSTDNTLTLAAAANVIFNAPVTATGNSAGLVIQYGSGYDYIVNAPITLSGASATLRIGTAGSLQTYTLIHSMADLDAIDSTGLSGKYALAQNLDATGTVYTNALITGSFTGVFTGLGNTISNLEIDAPTVDNVGLFANANYGSTVRDVSLVYGSVIGKGSVGALAGIAAGKVSNVSTNLTVIGSDSFVGGLVGLNSGGGAGIWNSSATGSVTGVDYVGGIAGNSQATITRSYATGAVNGQSYVGGVAGITGDTVSETYATGAVTATGDFVGGLVGMNGAVVQNSYATGSVKGASNTGGLVGINYGLVGTSYALGSVTGTDNVGGLVGTNQDATIDTNYASGAVTGTSNVGGLVGSNTTWGTVSSSYWDTGTTGQAHSAGSTDNFGLTTADARQSSSYSGWDFSTVWYQDGEMRPIGRWEAAPSVNGVISISNAHQLQLANANLAGVYSLSSDIDASMTSGANAAGIWSTAGFVPLGSSSSPFTGKFDGQGHVVSNLSIQRPSTNQVGLFGQINAAVISNIGLVGGSITGGSEVGGLIGHDDGSTVSTSYSTADISGAWSVGGLVGYTESGTYNSLYATGDVTSAGSAGGLIGYAGGTAIDKSYSSGAVSGRGAVGGLVGTLKNSSDGSHTGTITRSYATGDVFDDDDPDSGETVGGLVGSLQDGSISESYATGSVTLNASSSDGNDYLVGGLVGDNYYGNIQQAYSTGEVVSSACAAVNCVAGGFAGRSDTGTISTSYWDTDTSGMTVGIGSDPSSSAVTPFTTANAFDESTYAGFDFSGTWYLIPNETRPFLRSEWSATIVNAHQLQLMTLNLDAAYTLGANIDLSATTQAAQMWNTLSGFSPIGDMSNAFNGSFDGTGHTISNLTIDRSAFANSYAGLFGNTGGTSVIRNVGLVSGYVTGSDVSTGSLVGSNAGTLENVFSNVGVTGNNGAGGLVGTNSGSISVASATGPVIMSGANPLFGGGLVGINTGTIEDAFAIGGVNGGDVIGALVGYNTGSIERTYAFGYVGGTGTTVGALVGANDGSIAASYWLMGSTPGVASGSGTVTTSGDLTFAEFQDTAFFVSTASAAGWNFDTTWAPPSAGYIPDLYALTPIVWVKGVSTTSTYGDSSATTTSAISVGGPARYVFGPAGDSIMLTGRTIDFAPTTPAGTSTISINQNQSGNSDSGQNYRIFYYGDDVATVAKATLTATFAGTVTKVYDGTTTASLASNNFTLTGVVNSDNVLISPTTGAYATANAGSGINVSASGLTLTGTDAANYTLLTTSLSGNIGTITQASLSAVLAGTVTKVYNGNTTASLASNNFTLTGIIGSDNVAVAPATGAYATANAGSGISVSASGLTLTGTAASNYTLTTTSLSGNIGTITQASLSAVLAGTVTKVYNGNTTASFASNNFTLTGVVGSDDVAITPTSGTYATANAGSGINVSVSGMTLTGTDAANYSLSTTSLSGNIGTITQASLSAVLAGTVTKVYNGNTTASLASSNFTLTGVVGSEDVEISPATGAYATANAGSGIGVSVSGLTLTGSDAANYTLSTTSLSGNIGTITQASLSAVLAGTVTKVYNGNTTASFASNNFTLTGVVGSDNVAVTPASGTYATANAGSGIGVSVSGLTLTGTDAANYSLTTTSLSGNIGTITQASLSAVLAGTVTKVYNGTTVASLASNNFTLTGVVGSEDVEISPATGAYATANAGSGIGVSVSGLTLTGTDASNYTLSTTSLSGNIGTITQASLSALLAGTVTKVYNGNTTASFASNNFTLTGVVGSDDVEISPASGTYATANAGSGIGVSVSGLTLTGTDAANYSLSTTSLSGNIGTITQASLSALLAGTVTKVYNGNTTASFASNNFTLTGVVGSDDVAITPTSGTYATANAGSGIGVSVSGLTLTGTDAANYSLSTTSLSGNIGTITQASLSALLAGTVIKVYNGNTTASFASNNFTLTGVVGSDDVAITPTSGTYATANAGSGIGVSVSGLTLTGTDAANYSLSTTSLSGNIGTITQASLSALLAGTVTKVYNGTTTASFASNNFTLTGVVGSDDVAITPTSGTYATANAGSGIGVSVSGLTLTGTDAANYSLSTTSLSGNIGTITQASLSALLAGTVTKVYNGNTTAGFASNNFTLTGVVGSDDVEISPATGAYATANAGSGIGVSVSGLTLTGTDAANYSLSTTSLSGNIGTITQASLSALLAGTVTKVYNGTTVASLASNNFTLTGVVGSDDVEISPATGAYATANAGSGIGVSVSGLTLTGTDAANYSLSTTSLSGNIGTITQASLSALLAGTVTKVYNGNTTASFASNNFTLTGVVGSDDVLISPATGTYATANAGSGIGVSVSGLTLTGSDAANYTLSTTSLSGNIGTITQASLSALLAGTVTKVYNGNTVASFASNNFTLTGVVGSDDVAITPTSGTYATANAGSGINVSVSGLTLTGTDAANYSLSTTSLSGNIGTITQASLSALLAGTVTKVYNGTTTASFASNNFTLTGVVGSDDVLISPATGAYATANAGSGINVSVSGLTLTGTDAANYSLSTTSLSGNIGTITQASLSALLAGTVTKVYNGNTTASFASNNFTLTGVVGSDDVAITPTSGTYASANAGSGINVSVSGLTLTGTDAANYSLSTTSLSGNIGTITQASLSAILAGTVTKVYNGTTVASFASNNFTLTGVVGSDDVLISPASGTYATANAGSGIGVSVSGLTLTGTDAANYSLSTTSLSGNIGTITQASLSALLAGTVTKVYNGTTVASFASNNFTLTGVVGSDDVVITPTSGTYATANAGSGIGVSVSGLTLTGTDAANYSLSTTALSGNIGTITQASLSALLAGTVTRVYNGTTVASLASNNFTLTGVVGSDDVEISPATGAYATANAGSGIGVSVSGLTLTGSDAANYTLSTTSLSGNIGTITQASLSAVLAGTVTKVYNGNTTASFASNNFTLTGVVGSDDVEISPASGTYATANAGSGIGVSVSGLTLTGTDAANYSLSTTSLSGNIGTITQASLSALLAGTVTKVYNGNTTASFASNNFTLTGVVGSDDVAITPTSGTYATANAGTGIGVSVSGLTLTGTDAANYSLSTTSLSGNIGTITQASLSALLAGTVTKVYNGNTTASFASNNFTLTGVVGSDDVEISPATGAYATANAGSGIGVSVSGLTLTGTDAANYSLSTTSLSGNIGTITQASLSALLAGTVTKVYNGNNTASFASNNFTLTGVVGSDDVLIAPATGTYATANAGSGINVSVSGLTLTGTDAANYSLTTTSLSGNIGTITQASLSALLAGTVTKVYNGTTVAEFASNNFTLTGVVGSDDVLVAPATGAYASANAGSGIGVSVSGLTLTGTDAANYSLATTSLSGNIGTITQASLSALLAGTVTKVYNGTTVAEFASNNFTLTGVVGSDDVLVAPATGAYASANAGSGIGVSVSGLTLTGTAASNYTLTTTSLSGNIGTITQAALSITASNAAKVYGQVATLSGFTSSGLQNGETIGSVTLTSAGQAATASVAGSPYTIIASNATGGTFNASNYDITYHDGALVVSPAILTATAGTTAKIYGAAVPVLGYTLSGWQNGDQATTTATGIVVSTTATTASGVGSYLTSASGGTITGAAAGNYVLGYATGTLAVNPAALTVTASNVSKTYGAAIVLNGSSGFTVAGLVNGDSVTSVALSSSGTAATTGVGTYGIAASGAQGSGLANYTIAYVDGILTVNPAALLVTAANATKTYGNGLTLDGATGFTTAGLLNGDSVASVTLASSGTATTAGVGSYGIIATNALGSGLGNYTITYVDGTMTVTPRPITVAANNAAMTAGSAIPPLTWTIALGNLVNGDTLTGALATSATSSSTAGTYPILQGSLAASVNYDLTYVPGTLVVRASNGPTPQQIVTLVTASTPTNRFVQTSASSAGVVFDTGSTSGSDTGNGSGASSTAESTGSSATTGEDSGSGCTGGATASASCTTTPHPANTRVGRFLRFSSLQ